MSQGPLAGWATGISVVVQAVARRRRMPLAPMVTDHDHIAWRENADMTSMSAGSSTPYIPASSPRSADVVLYLDLDGVVPHEAVLWHPRRGIYMSPYQASEHSLFEWLPLLQKELAPYPQVAIVLSSTWCIRPGYAKTLQLLPKELSARFIGGTFHKRVHGADPWLLASFRNTPRGQQILEDVMRRRPRQWLALDDDIEDWPPAILNRLVACAGKRGLSDPQTRMALRNMLQKCDAELAGKH
ncbi:MAG: HAD domain-containing protein [Pseudomonadales bacterium]